MTPPLSTLGQRSLSDDQVARLAELVWQGLKQFNDGDIRAPRPCDFVAENHWAPSNCFELALDVDIGSTVLTLRSERSWMPPFFGPDTDLAVLADGICYQVGLARSDEKGLERLKAVEASARAKIKRDRLPLDDLSVRFAPLQMRRSVPPSYRGLWSRVAILDHLLLPYSELMQESSRRTICRALKKLGQEQIERLKVQDRLAAQGAILEIEATAEHAIRVSGQSVGDVVNRMLNGQTPDRGAGAGVKLWGDDNGADWVGVYAHNGRIRLDAQLGPLTWNQKRGITVERAFPHVITNGLIGRPLSNLIQHRLLLGSAPIADAEKWSEYHTKISLLDPARPITRAELISDASGKI